VPLAQAVGVEEKPPEKGIEPGAGEHLKNREVNLEEMLLSRRLQTLPGEAKATYKLLHHTISCG
jgi:hypothetical protein